MNTDKKRFIVQKAAGKDAYACIEEKSGKRKSGKITGNFPKLYPSMLFSAVVSYGELKEIEVPMSPHNMTVLSNNGEDIDRYRIALARYDALRPLGYGWREASLNRDELYAALPFIDADRIHRATVNMPSDPIRLAAMTKAVLSYGRQNRRIKDYSRDTFLACCRKVQESASYPALSETEFLSLTSNECFVKVTDDLWRDKELDEMEAYVSASIRTRLANRFPLLSEKKIQSYSKSNMELDSDQRQTLNCLSDSAPAVITGSAGSGKTTMVKAIIECFGKDALLVAPTGRAARRLHAQTGQPAWTIHKVLRLIPDEDIMIAYDENNPLPNSLVVVDEASMVGTELMCQLLRAIKADAKIIFVGDCNQLQPVPYGQPYVEFCETLKTYRLTHNHRQDEGTDIVETCFDVLNGKPITDGRNVTVREISLNDLESVLPKDLNLMRSQFISPFHAINNRINNHFKKGRAAFSRDDKVIFLRNTKNYCNGDIGIVLGVFDDEMVVQLCDGQAGSDTITITKKEIKDVALAYGITVHKMQGSETDEIIAFLPKNPWGKEDDIRKMRYTALSRARKSLTVYFYTE